MGTQAGVHSHKDNLTLGDYLNSITIRVAYQCEIRARIGHGSFNREQRVRSGAATYTAQILHGVIVREGELFLKEFYELPARNSSTHQGISQSVTSSRVSK